MSRTSLAAGAIFLLISHAASAEDAASLMARIEAAPGSEAREQILDSAGAALNHDLLKAAQDRASKAVNGADSSAFLRAAEAEVAIARRVGTRKDVGLAWSDLGLARFRAEDYRESLEAYRQALAVGETTHDADRMAAAFNGMGLALRDLGRFDESLDAFEKAEQSARQSNDSVFLARVFNNTATTLIRTGNSRRAAEKLEQALEIAQKHGERMGQAFVLNNLGNVYQEQGDYNLALTHYQKSLAIKQSSGNQRDVISTLLNIALSYEKLDRLEESRATINRILPIARELKLKRLTASLLNNRAMIERRTGEVPRALDDLREAIAIAEPGGDQEFLSSLMSSTAEIEFVTGFREKAIADARKACDFAQAANGRRAIASCAEVLGRFLLATKSYDEAGKVLETGAEAVESMWSDSLPGEVNAQGFLTTHVAVFDALSDLMVRSGQDEAAFQVAEKMKARVLVDVLRRGRVAITKAMTLEEKQKELELQNEVSRASAKLAARPGPQAKVRRNQALQELASFRARLYASHPELKFQRAEYEPATLQQIAPILPDRQTAAVEYVVSEEVLLLFVIRRDADGKPSLHVYRLAAKFSDLEKLAKNLRAGIASRGYEWRGAARQLHQMLLGPAQAQLRGVTTLLVVPDGIVWQVPFAALLDASNRYVVEKMALFYAPSLTALLELSKHPPKTAAKPSLLAFANPKFGGAAEALPETAAEARAIAKLYGPSRSKVYTGEEALESRVRSDAGRYSVLHLATHGSISDANPLYSYLRLTADPAHGDDGLLETREMLDLNLNADVAVLSACDTAAGPASRGEGVIGMSWALLVAGASSTIVSQWRVDSAATSQWMVRFHREMASSPNLAHKARALQRASLGALHGGPYKHPFYWAAFQLIGNGF